MQAVEGEAPAGEEEPERQQEDVSGDNGGQVWRRFRQFVEEF